VSRAFLALEDDLEQNSDLQLRKMNELKCPLPNRLNL
jgi:hypothetical protein